MHIHQRGLLASPHVCTPTPTHDLQLTLMHTAVVHIYIIKISWTLNTTRHGFGPPFPQQKVGTNGQKWVFSNLYKELGFDSIHNFDIVAGSLYSLRSSLKFSLVNVKNFPMLAEIFGKWPIFNGKNWLRYPTGRYEYTCNAYAMYGSQILHQ